MKIELIEKAEFHWDEMKTSLQLDKTICVFLKQDRYSEGHFFDYLNSSAFVVLRAKKETRLLLWDSSLLINHCTYNDALSVHFHVQLDQGENAAIMNVEALRGNNGFILRKFKERYDLTFYFSLLHSHALTGELLVSPCFYLFENPHFTLSPEAKISIGELLKINPIDLKIKENQVLCFDKFHYQMQYNPNVSFLRL